MYQAMARRFRPETFDGVIGQEHVAQTLKNAIAADRVAHAYLFCGPHGCGKTSMARIFAKALVCEQGPTQTPCNQCDLCRDIMRGQDIDVQEIDGASNNGVDQVRQLRDQVSYVPNRARYKIYIIDEVHMLSTPAFNALLKTLEEPPPHVKFILATTDPHKLPDTVISRCQRFDFRLAPPPLLAAFLKDIVAREKAEVEPDAIDAVAAFSNGSVRDSLVLMDQLLSYAQGRVTRQDVEGVRGVASAEMVAGLFHAMVESDTARALQLVDEVASHGTNVGDFLDQLIEYGRDLMLLVVTGKDDGISAYGPARAALGELAAGLDLDAVLLMLDVLTQARTRVRSRALSNTLVPLEMAVARLCSLDALTSLGDIIDRLDSLGSGAPLPIPATMTAHPSAATPDPRNQSADTEATTSVPPPQPAPKAEPTPEPAATIAVPGPSQAPAENPTATSTPDDSDPADSAPARIADQASSSQDAVVLDLDRAKSAWATILEHVGNEHPADMIYLKKVEIAAIEDNTIILRSPGAGSFLTEQLDDPQRKARLTKAASKVLGTAVGVKLRREQSAATPGTGNVAPESRPGSSPPGARRPSPQQRIREEAQSDPAVKMVMDLFDGQIMNVQIEES